MIDHLFTFVVVHKRRELDIYHGIILREVIGRFHPGHPFSKVHHDKNVNIVSFFDIDKYPWNPLSASPRRYDFKILFIQRR